MPYALQKHAVSGVDHITLLALGAPFFLIISAFFIL
jgi:hypothetical protein